MLIQQLLKKLLKKLYGIVMRSQVMFSYFVRAKKSLINFVRWNQDLSIISS